MWNKFELSERTYLEAQREGLLNIEYLGTLINGHIDEKVPVVTCPYDEDLIM